MINNYPLIYKLSNNADYSEITNKPKINNVELTGNKSSSDLGLVDTTTVGDLSTLTTTEQSSIVAATNEINAKFPVTIANGGTGATTATDARTNLGVVLPVPLYGNAAGNTGTVTLNDAIGNYTLIEITTKNGDGSFLGFQMWNDYANSINGVLTIPSAYMSGNENRISLKVRQFSISGDTITWTSGSYANLKPSSTYVSTAAETAIGICKVVGYKY